MLALMPLYFSSLEILYSLLTTLLLVVVLPGNRMINLNVRGLKLALPSLTLPMFLQMLDFILISGDLQ